MKLKKDQKTALIAWIAEGLETGEINKRAAKFKPHFKVTRQQVDFYRKTRDVNIQEIKQEEEFDALRNGLALREERVRVLQDLADLLKADLLGNNKLWLDMKKSVGSGEPYEYKEFNAAEIAQLRGILDDIASEVGERVKRQEVTGRDGKPLIPAAKFDFTGLSDEDINIIERAVEISERQRPEQPAFKG